MLSAGAVGVAGAAGLATVAGWSPATARATVSGSRTGPGSGVGQHHRAGVADEILARDQSVALTQATVIDATGAPPRPDMTVLIQDGRITALGPSSRVRVPGTVDVVNLRGRFVIPGLAEMHAHSGDLDTLWPALYIANGVTTVREMAGYPFVREFRNRIEAGALLGPRWVVASPIIDGSPSIWSGAPAPYLEVRDAGEARLAVRLARRDSPDFIKVYSRLSRESFHAIADEARRQGLPFVGHTPDLISVTEASDAGQRSMEHMLGTWYATSSRETELRRRLADLTIAPGDMPGWFAQIQPVDWIAAHSYDPRRAAGVYARLRANRSWQVPTLTMHRIVDLPDEVPLADDRMRYLPPSTAQQWAQELDVIWRAGRTAEEAARHRELFQHRLRFVGRMRRAGVPILAGTDSGMPGAIPGFILHDELALLVRAGLTPMQALQTATLEPARFLGLEGSLGTVRVGNLADLVVLDANPLTDIRNTQRIHAVVTRGRLISVRQRRRLLADIEAAARDSP